jgi:hypothetical protein
MGWGFGSILEEGGCCFLAIADLDHEMRPRLESGKMWGVESQVSRKHFQFYMTLLV